MTAINWLAVQARLGVKQDGQFGPASYAALISRIGTLGGHRALPLADQLAAGFLAHASAYQIDANSERFAQCLGQCGHESGGFTLMRETWGPTAAQRGYDAPGNTLGNHPGDGFALRGAGAIEVTGRRNLTAIGDALGLDLVGNQHLLDYPATGVLISLEWWRQNGMNALADTGDTMRVAKAVNCGSPNSKRAPNGMASRVAFTNIARSLVA